MKILINRNDNLGDIIYTLQLAALLKSHYSNCQVFFLVRNYALPLFDFTPNVDGCLSWEVISNATKQERQNLLQTFDVFINAKASKAAAKFAKEAKIKLRIGNTHRIFHWLYCNKLVSIKRKHSSQHEIELNSQFLRPLIDDALPNIEQQFKLINLQKIEDETIKPYLSSTKQNIICHPASNGNGREWPIAHYINLIQQADKSKYHFVLTGSPGEKTVTDKIHQACPDTTNIAGETNLKQLISLIGKAQLLISAGTGPLHIAAAIGTPTIGLFPPKHALDSKRWGPPFPWSTNLELKKACQQTCSNDICKCMADLTPNSVLSKLNKIKTTA